MRPKNYLVAAAIVAATMAAGPAAAQQVETTPPLEVGVEAPDFTLPGATRHGILRDHVSLRDYRGKTVVLAFFFRARSRG